jgi:hypothetical protein
MIASTKVDDEAKPFPTLATEVRRQDVLRRIFRRSADLSGWEDFLVFGLTSLIQR